MASFAAGTVATTICAPADVLKSRMQSSSGKQVLLKSADAAQINRLTEHRDCCKSSAKDSKKKVHVS